MRSSKPGAPDRHQAIGVRRVQDVVAALLRPDQHPIIRLLHDWPLTVADVTGER